MKLSVELAPKMLSLFYDKAGKPFKRRYRIAHGGRGGSKSYGFADMALVRMAQKRTDIAVCREYHTTIKDSVHKLLVSRIDFHGLNEAFDINNDSIIYKPNGSQVRYKHLHDNYTEVRGLEGNHVCWIFEGHDLQAESWSVLDPTIRRTPTMEEDPEFWIEFNPQYADDFIYRRFVVDTPKGAVVVQINYTDNPWCPEDTIALAEQCRLENQDQYEHIWLGRPRNVGGLVYPQFDEEVNIRALDLSKVEVTANFFMGQDPHLSYYPFCVWGARVMKDRPVWYIYNEWPTRSHFGGKYYHELRTEQKCQLSLRDRARIYRVCDNTTDQTYHGVVMQARGIDTRFAKGSGATSSTTNTRGIIQEMADTNNGGLDFETPPEHMIDVQRERIREMLAYDRMIPLTVFNEPSFFVAPWCENVIDMFRLHRFDKDGREKEDETRKDPSDAIKIMLAVAQQHPHVDRSKRPEPIIQQQSSVDALVAAYRGGPDIVDNIMVTTPSCATIEMEAYQ